MILNTDCQQDPDKYVNAKVREFLSEIVSNTVVLSTHCCRIEATPFDVAHALRLFAEDGPKFVFDYSSDTHNVWRLDPTEEEGEQEDLDLNITDSIVDDISYLDNDDDVYSIDENKYQEDSLIFYAKYPPVSIKELSDKQLRKEVLQPLFHPYRSFEMGFDIDEEDYVYDEGDQGDIDPSRSQLRDAPVIIGMIKRAMYAFIVPAIRKDIHIQVQGKAKMLAKKMQGQINSLKSKLKKQIPKLETQAAAYSKKAKEMAAKQAEMQAKIDSLKEQLEKSIPEMQAHVCSLKDQVKKTVPGNESTSKRLRVEGGRSTDDRPRTRSNIRQVQVKQESIRDGAIKCPDPDCGNIIFLGEKGCNRVVCTKHKPHFLYFCAHCKIRGEPSSEILGCDCPKRNTPEDRVMAQEMRNKRARKNPEVLE